MTDREDYQTLYEDFEIEFHKEHLHRILLKKNLRIRNKLLFEIISKQKSDHLLRIRDLKINNKNLSEEK